jgi:hypothetical protein
MIEKLKTLRQYIIIKSLIFFFSKTVYDYCDWSKEAEWRDGDRKRAFIASDWRSYLKLYLKDKIKK